MNRREFLKTCVGLGAAAGAAALFGRVGHGPGQAFAQDKPATKATPDLVAVRGGEPEAMFDKAIQRFGGMGAFVKKGKRKPNGKPAAKKAMPMMPEHEQIGNEIMGRLTRPGRR